MLAASDPPMTPLDLKPLTALRFAAAVWVVSFHYWPHLAGVGMPMVVSNGYLGVELFFVLSGFILSHVYLQSFGEGRFRYGGFLWARIARVYPLHIAVLAGLGVLAVAATAAGMTLGTGLVNFAALPANILLLHAWGVSPAAAWNHPSWSISAEWFAYVSFPAFAWAAWRLKDRPSLAVIGVLILLFGLYTLFEALAGFPLTSATYKWGALRIVPCFAYGAAIYLMWRAGTIATRTQAKFWSAAFAVLILALAQVDAPDAAIVTACGGLILALAGLTSTGSSVLTGKVGVYLGEISYAVYMCCFPWLLVFGKAMEKLGYGPTLPPVLWGVLFVGVVPVAIVAHHLVERPARTLLRRWADLKFPLSLRPVTRPA